MKRFIALFIAATLTLTAAFNIYGDDKGLSDAITAAKQYITVPESRADVDYNISNGKNGAVIISLSWSDDKGETNVTLDKDGCLLGYSDYSYENNKKTGLAKLTETETKAKADSFLKTAYGEGASSFRLEYSNLSRYAHSYTYYIYKNDIRVTTARATVSVDPDTGEISSFDGVGKEFFSLKYPSPSSAVSVESAMKAFYDGELPKPIYRISTEYKDRKITKSAFLAFSVYDTNTAINALNNQRTSVNRYFNEYIAEAKASSADMAAGAEEAADDNGFTPQELEAIESAEGLINTQRAAEIIKKYFPVAKDLSFSSSHISKNSYDGEYYINIQAEGGYASLNAKTGKVISFSCYNLGYGQAKTKLTDTEIAAAEEKAEPIAKNLAEQLAPQECKKIGKPKLNTNNYTGEVNISYGRIENGYECASNYISVSVNNKGEVISYRNGFDNVIAFPKPQKVLSGSEAVNALAEVFDFDLCYTVEEDYSVELVYSFNKTGLMDEASPQLLDYKGKPMKEDVESGISDVKGHWCEAIVTTLYNNGYKLNDTLFRPDQAITKGELEALYGRGSYEPYYYENADDDEASAEMNETLTRYELSEYIMTYYNLDMLKDYPDIFSITAYKDEIKEEYVPAVAIATAIGALSGDNTDSFNGDKEVTRAEAAAALYNMLTRVKNAD